MSLATLVLIVLGVVIVLVLSSRGRRSPHLPATPRKRADLDQELGRALATGRKIDAIKAYRRLHGVGLKEAKEAVERLMP